MRRSLRCLTFSAICSLAPAFATVYNPVDGFATTPDATSLTAGFSPFDAVTDYYSINYENDISDLSSLVATPEPGLYLVMAVGLGGLLLGFRRRRPTISFH